MGIEELGENEIVTCQQAPITPSSLLSTLDQFLYYATGSCYPNVFSFIPKKNERKEESAAAAVESALFLLQNLPPSKNAALTFLSDALSQTVWKFMQGKELRAQALGDLITNQISTVVNELIETSPVIWCPLVAEWSVGLLGKWSLEWEGVFVNRDSTLEERVASWLNCPPTRVLANLTLSCVAQDADKTVAVLLEESVRNGVALNWLVAHVGCSFPATIVNRILSLGLRSFVSASTSNEANQQLNSVNTVISHLAERHFPEIQRELHNILMNTFEEPDNTDKAVVPYLLQLANINRSRALLRALANNLPEVLQSEKTCSLTNAMSWWIPKYFPNSESLTDLLVTLLMDVSGDSACHVIFLLIKNAYSNSNSKGGYAELALLLEIFISQLSSIVYRRPNSSSFNRIPVLKALGDDTHKANQIGGSMTISDLIEFSLESGNDFVVKRMGQILTLVVTEQGSEASAYILQNLLRSYCSIKSNHLFLLNVVMGAIVKRQPSTSRPFKTVSSAISFNLRNDDINGILNTVNKLNSLLNLVREPKMFIQEAILNALLPNISLLAKLINVPSMSLSVLELLCFLPLEKPLSLSELMSLCHAVVYFYFRSLKNNSQNKLKSFGLVRKILMQLSHSSLAHSLLLRLIFESVVSPEWSDLFGAKSTAVLEFKESPRQLLLANHQFDSWVKVPTSHNTRFHAGAIGRKYLRGKRSKITPTISKEEAEVNTQLVLNLLSICSRSQGMNHVATTLALLMVEYISPDIMFNGFPWPEEYIKFTFERDLSIKKTFDEFPIIWRFLELVARSRPALCYCSVLIRGLTASLTAFWNTSPLTFAKDDPVNLTSTKTLMEIMVVGQFLPRPFGVLPQMIDKLAPHEVVCILQDIWTYLRDHTPSPDRWMQLSYGVHHRSSEEIDPRYTERIRKLIHVHIDIFGHLLPVVLKST